MTATREIVTDKRDEFAFHDDIAYLRETKRGLTRQTVEEISGFKNEPDWMLQSRLRAYDHFLKSSGYSFRPWSVPMKTTPILLSSSRTEW